MKVCNRCLIEQPLEEFHRHPLGVFGRHPTCRTCRNAAGRASYVPGRHRKRDSRAANLRHWGLTEADLSSCRICGTQSKLVIDHDHKTGLFRGVLCSSCNIGIGHMADSPERLELAAQYLRRGRIAA